jgi:hypothetical protein
VDAVAINGDEPGLERKQLALKPRGTTRLERVQRRRHDAADLLYNDHVE